MNLWEVAAVVLVINLPFGYWRANVRKLSRQWFIAIHLPVVLTILVRILSGLGFELISFPIMIGAFFSGQFLGGKFYLWWKAHVQLPPSSCLIWDVVKSLQSR